MGFTRTTEMSVFEKRFFTITRSLLVLVGLWPFADRKEKLLRGFLVQIGLLVGIFVQTMRLIISRNNADLVVEVLSYIMTAIVVLTIYSSIYFMKHSKQIGLFESIDNEWRKVENVEEYEILKKFAEKTRKIVIVFMSEKLCVAIIYLHVGIFVPTSTYPLILDVINPLNKTRQTKFVPLLEYFSGRERCILKILPIYYLAMLWEGIAITATISFVITCVQHICSMFALTGYLMTHAFSEQSISGIDDANGESYARIVRAVKCHKRAFYFQKQLNSSFERSSLVAYALALTLIALGMSQINKLDVKRLSLIVLQVVIISAISANGQKIIDHSGSVFESAIMTRWYLAPVRTQKLFLLIMMRSMRPSYLSIGGLFVCSNEFCLSLIKNSVSYGMVLHSMR